MYAYFFCPKMELQQKELQQNAAINAGEAGFVIFFPTNVAGTMPGSVPKTLAETYDKYGNSSAPR